MLGEGAVPHARRFAVTGVVVVPIATDLVDVVGDARTGITGTNRSHGRHHQQPPAPADRHDEEHQVHRGATRRRPIHTLSVARDATVIDRLADLGYQRRAGNRFARTFDDVPVRVDAVSQPSREAVIDILVPAYTSRPRDNHRFGDHLVTCEVPGLANALQRPRVILQIAFGRLNGDTLDAELTFPDEVAVARALRTSAAQVGVRQR